MVLLPDKTESTELVRQKRISTVLYQQQLRHLVIQCHTSGHQIGEWSNCQFICLLSITLQQICVLLANEFYSASNITHILGEFQAHLTIVIFSYVKTKHLHDIHLRFWQRKLQDTNCKMYISIKKQLISSHTWGSNCCNSGTFNDCSTIHFLVFACVWTNVYNDFKTW